MSEEDKQKEINRLKNQDRGRVVKTTSVDFFLNCDTMDLDDIQTNDLVKPQLTEEIEDDDEDPEWNDVDIDEIKAPTTNAAVVTNEQKQIKEPAKKAPSSKGSSKHSSNQAQNLQEQDEAIISITPKQQSLSQQIHH